jgi:hypothetical protein
MKIIVSQVLEDFYTGDILTGLNRLLSVELVFHLLHLTENNSVQVLEKSYTYCSYSCYIKNNH